jgi:hypothetical protein
MENMVVLTATPTASVNTATTTKPGLFARVRRARRKSFSIKAGVYPQTH